MIRVLHVIAGMNAGGMETMIMNYYRNIDRSKIQFDFLITKPEKCFFEDEINSLGGKIFRITARKRSFLKNRRELSQFFKNNPYRLVEFHQGITYFYPLKMAKKYGVKHRIIHNHGIDEKHRKYLKWYSFYAKSRISNMATDFFACSEEVVSHLFTKKIINKEKVHIISNAIDMDKYRYDQKARNEVKQELKIEGKKVCAHIGTFTYPKNHKKVIEIFYCLYKKDPNVILLLIGDGPLRKEIEELVIEKNLQKVVYFMGIRKDINKMVSAIDILIFPSLFEGIPLTLIEAQTSGIAVFTSNTVNSKVRINSNCFFLSIEDNEEKWVKAIEENKVEKSREELFTEAIKTRYNIKREAPILEEIYETMK